MGRNFGGFRTDKGLAGCVCVLIDVFCELVFQEAESSHPEEIFLNLQA